MTNIRKYPLMNEVLNGIQISKEKLERRQKERQTYLCIGINDVRRGNIIIHAIIKKFRDKLNLKWIRI